MSSQTGSTTGKPLSSITRGNEPQQGATLGTFVFKEQSPWVKRVLRSYTDRMRVSNFSPVGNVVFSEILQKALTGRKVYFSMTPNGRAAKTWTTTTPIDQSSNESEPVAPVETISDNQSGQQSISNGEYSVTKNIQSGLDPIDQDTIPEARKDEFPDSSLAASFDYAGICYDANNEPIPNLFCLSLEDPVIDEKVIRYSAAAEQYDNSVIAALPDIVKPQKLIRGMPNNTQVKRYEQTTDSGDDTTWLFLPKDGNKAGGQVTVPNAEILGPQWNTQLMAGFMSALMMEFLGLVNVPPVDFPEIGTLTQQTQSLVSNREPFVSRMKRIRAEVDAVFSSAGIPELSWELPFPYTPQDIASIGDANGKGVNSETLRSMNLG